VRLFVYRPHNTNRLNDSRSFVGWPRQRKGRTLPAKFVASEYVAQIHNSLSVGRHCRAVGSAGKADWKTRFSLDGQVLIDRLPVSRYRLWYLLR